MKFHIRKHKRQDKKIEEYKMGTIEKSSMPSQCPLFNVALHAIH